MALFPTTFWTFIEAQHDDKRARAALLEHVVKRYRRPLAVIASTFVSDTEAVDDLVQSFWMHLLERDGLAELDRNQGRLRSFLRRAFKNFCISEQRRQGAQKRGGEAHHVDGDVVELQTHDDELTTKRFDRQWAEAIFDTAATTLRERTSSKQWTLPNALVESFLSGAEISYATAAREMNATPAQVKSWLHRLRKTFRTCIEREVAATMPPSSGDDAIARELSYLRECLAERAQEDGKNG